MCRVATTSRRCPRRQLWRACAGSTVVEFAIVVAPLLALILAILNVATIFFANELLETAAENVSRSIMTGQVQNAGLTSSQLKQQACATLPLFLSCSSLMMDVQKAASFGDINTSAPTLTFDKNGNVTNSWSYDIGGSGAIVIVRLMYIWPTSTGPFGVDFGNVGPGQRLLVATTVSKTEPY